MVQSLWSVWQSQTAYPPQRTEQQIKLLWRERVFCRKFLKKYKVLQENQIFNILRNWHPCISIYFSCFLPCWGATVYWSRSVPRVAVAFAAPPGFWTAHHVDLDQNHTHRGSSRQPGEPCPAGSGDFPLRGFQILQKNRITAHLCVIQKSKVLYWTSISMGIKGTSWSIYQALEIFVFQTWS